MLGGEGAGMTTLDGVTKKKPAELSAEQQAAAELVRLAQEQGLSLAGPDGLLKQLTKTVHPAGRDGAAALELLDRTVADIVAAFRGLPPTGRQVPRCGFPVGLDVVTFLLQ